MSSPRSALRRPSMSAVPRLMLVPSAVTAAMLAMTSPRALSRVLDRTIQQLGQRGAIALGLLVEHLLAVATAEVHGALRELRAELRGHAVDHHAADRILRLDANQHGRGGLRLDGDGLVTAAVLDDLGEDAHGDLFWGDRADVEPGRRLEPAEPVGRGAALLHALHNRRGAPLARHQADVARVGLEHPRERVLVGVSVAGDHDRGAWVEPELGELRRLVVFGERRDREAGGSAEG